MQERLALLAALALTGTALSGCTLIPKVGEAPATIAPAAVATDPATPPPTIIPADITAEAGEGTDAAQSTPPDQSGFGRFVRYTQAAARQAASGAEVPSAMLADPVALDGKRRRCAPGEKLVAIIDLDPAGRLFSPPANPVQRPGLVVGAAILRAEGVEIAWLSDVSTDQSGRLRTVLEQSGIDPRGQDIISLRRDEADRKDQRKASLGAIACIVAIAGDERSDFDLRFKYLRNPKAGTAIEALIGDGWFLVEPLLGN